MRLEQVCGELREQPAGDLAHRFEHWQLAVVALDQLITNSGALGRRKSCKPTLRQHWQAEKAADDLAWPEQALRCFGHTVDRHQEIATAVDLLRVINDLRARGVEIVVGKTCAEAGLMIDIDPMPSTDERLHTGRCQRDTLLIGQRRPGNCNIHRYLHRYVIRDGTLHLLGSIPATMGAGRK